MALTIPLNEANWTTFYHKVIKAGGKVRSRYKGVTISTANHRPQFMTRYQGATVDKFLGRFPLTKEGEELAKKTYDEYIDNIDPSEISKYHGRTIKNKIK